MPISLDIFTKVLSDQTRLRILLLLMPGEELCVCELMQALDLAQPKISRHLAVLRSSGLLHDRKAGLWVYYRLQTPLPAWVLAALQALQQGAQQAALYQADQQRLAKAERQDSSCKR